MVHNLTDDQVKAFNFHYKKAGELSKELVILNGNEQLKLNFLKRRKINKAIKHYNKCVQLVPDHWPSMWLMAKLYQSLGESEKALLLFEDALELEKENPDIAREASISAMNAGKVEEAIKYSEEAINRAPENAGLMANHALNLLIAEKDHDALNWIKKAIEISPYDPINLNVNDLINKVINREVKRPKFFELK
ncbi:MAG: tetratricopeptide repeat protein [Bacteroidia bacterium]